MSNKVKLIIVFSSLVVVLAILTVLMKFGLLKSLDNGIYNFIIDHRGHKGGLIYVVSRGLTEFGGFIILPILCLLIGIYYKFDNRFFYIVLILIIAVLTNMLFKELIGRIRPDKAYRWMKETSNSYPSGHSVSTSSFYFSLICVEIKTDENKLFKRIIIILSIILMIIVPITRLILAVHYFTDIIAGILYGIIISLLGLLVLYSVILRIYNMILEKIRTE